MLQLKKCLLYINYLKFCYMLTETLWVYLYKMFIPSKSLRLIKRRNKKFFIFKKFQKTLSTQILSSLPYLRLKKFYRFNSKKVFKKRQSLRRIKHFSKIFFRRMPHRKYSNFLKYSRFVVRNNDNLSNSVGFPLQQRVFTTFKYFIKTTLRFFFTANKKGYQKYAARNAKNEQIANLITSTKQFKKPLTKLIYVNMHRSILRKLRNTRKIHWKVNNTGSLNSRRYQQYLKKEVKYTSKLFFESSLVSLFLRLFNLVIAWRHLKLLLSYDIVVCNGQLINKEQKFNLFDIIELPVGLALKKFKKKCIKHYKKYVARTKRWSYLNYLKSRHRLTRSKTSYPKVLTYLPALRLKYKVDWGVDVATHKAILLEVTQPMTYNYYQTINATTVLKLNHWKYKA